MMLASLLTEGSISYLYYADRLVEFPLGVAAMAAAHRDSAQHGAGMPRPETHAHCARPSSMASAGLLCQRPCRRRTGPVG